MKNTKHHIIKTCLGLTLVISALSCANFSNPSSMMSPFDVQDVS